MTPSPELVDRLLLEHSAETTLRTLKDAGYTPSIHRLHTRLSQLIASGRREAKKQTDRTPYQAGTMEVPKGASLEGSEKLLEACLSLYQRRASEVGVSVQDAMLFMLNAPERLGV